MAQGSFGGSGHNSFNISLSDVVTNYDKIGIWSYCVFQTTKRRYYYVEIPVQEYLEWLARYSSDVNFDNDIAYCWGYNQTGLADWVDILCGWCSTSNISGELYDTVIEKVLGIRLL